MANILSLMIQYWPWPIVALVSLFIFRGAISKLFADVKSLKAGSIELAFEKQIQQQGLSKDQTIVFKALSSMDIDLFLMISFSDDATFNYRTGMPVISFKESLLRLQSSGLIILTNPEDSGTNIRHYITPLGKRIRSLFVNTCTTLLQRES